MFKPSYQEEILEYAWSSRFRVHPPLALILPEKFSLSPLSANAKLQ